MAITLYRAGESHARTLIEQGRVDEESSWDFSAEDGDALLGDPPDWDRYASWFLGHDTEADKETKAAWKYPFGKDGKVYRSALRAIRTRAAQNNETEISDAARRLLDLMDEQKTSDLLATAPSRPTAQTRPWYRIQAQAAAPDAVDVNIYDAIGAWYDGISAKRFIEDLAALPEAVKTIRVHVNSPGGDVFDALAIANALRQHRARVEMYIEGLAASAATIVTNGGGDVIKIADNGLVMIHNPVGLAVGTAKDLRSVADALDRSGAAIVTSYQRVSALSREQLAAMMEAQTWMDADEAVANGFATEKVEGLKAAAVLSPAAVARFGNVPEKFRERLQSMAIRNDLKLASGAEGTSIEEFSQAVWQALRERFGDPWAPGAKPWWIVQTYEDAVVVNRDSKCWEYPVALDKDGQIALGEPFEVEMVWVKTGDSKTLTTKARAAILAKAPPAPASIRPSRPAAAGDVLQACAGAGLDLAFAQALVAGQPTIEAAQQQIATEKETRAAAATRATQIRALCLTAKLPELADGYVAGAMSLDDVKAHLTTMTAKLDAIEIDGSLRPDHAAAPPQLRAADIYAERNRLTKKE